MIAKRLPKYRPFANLDFPPRRNELNSATREAGVRETLIQCDLSLEAAAANHGDDDGKIGRTRATIGALLDAWR